MKTLKDLFNHQLKDLYSAEEQLSKAIPEFKEKASDSKLSGVFSANLEEIRTRKDRISEICNEMNISPTGEHCNAMEGLIKEAKSVIKEYGSDEVLNAGLIADAQRIAHYEISGYGTAARFARELGHHKVAEKLQSSLDQVSDWDEKLNDLAVERINQEAMA